MLVYSDSMSMLTNVECMATSKSGRKKTWNKESKLGSKQRRKRRKKIESQRNARTKAKKEEGN